MRLPSLQTNLSVPIVMPNIDCAHCVLRVRYNPNKPTESIFHQCADVAFTATAAPPAAAGRVFAFVRVEGSTPTAASSSHELAELLPSGAVQPVFETPLDGPEFVEGAWYGGARCDARAIELLSLLSCAAPGMSTALGPTIFSVARQQPREPQPGPDTPASLLVSFNTATRETRTVPITIPDADPIPPQQWTAIVAVPDWEPARQQQSGAPPTAVSRQPLALLGLRNEGDGTFTYQVGDRLRLRMPSSAADPSPPPHHHAGPPPRPRDRRSERSPRHVGPPEHLCELYAGEEGRGRAERRKEGGGD